MEGRKRREKEKRARKIIVRTKRTRIRMITRRGVEEKEEEDEEDKEEEEES